MRRAAAAAAGCALLLAACTSVSAGHGTATAPAAPTATQPAAPPATPTAQAGDPSCPASYARPDPHRPRVRLRFVVSDDLTTVRGTEHVSFTPDRPVTELVFRLTANTAPTVAAGNRIVVTAASAHPSGSRYTFTRAGAAAGTQGGLLHVPLASTVAAGTAITADLAFTLTLGGQSFDRFGRSGSGAGRYAWFGSGQPLLAWERGYGWHTEDMLQFTAESATSEAMDTDLTVVAPAADVVVMSGDPAAAPASGPTRSWHARLAAARDVSVAVGPFTVSDTRVGDVRLRVGATNRAQLAELVPLFRRAIAKLAELYGPFPFPSLSVARLPGYGGGIEYPSSILVMDDSQRVATHETAHQWFYALVGDSQAQHAWLDEAFAQFSEQEVDGTPEPDAALRAPGAVDRPTASYGTDANGYYYVTYDKGAAALWAARTATGAAAWSAAVRCYVNANAWRIARPADVAAALRAQPAALAVLRAAGALP
jgi:hypothetical protein